MNTDKTLKILEALASGCSPTTGEIITSESILNDREVIRALQFAIDHLKKDQLDATIKIDNEIVMEVLNLFKKQNRNPTPNSLTGFLLGTRQFKNQNLLGDKNFGKFIGLYSKGQLLDYFSNYLLENQNDSKDISKERRIENIEYFNKPKFNKLTENGIKQLKDKVNAIGILKVENLTEHIIESRKTHPRAYEQWSKVEIELLRKALQYTNDLIFLSSCFQRGYGSIESVAGKLVIESGNNELP